MTDGECETHTVRRPSHTDITATLTAPSPDQEPDPTQAIVPADAPRANVPGQEPPTGPPHPEGGTPAARPAAAEGTGGTRALVGDVGGQFRPAPVPDGKTRSASPMKDDAATPPAPHAQPPQEEPTVDATEEAGGPLQPKEAPLPTRDLSARGPPLAEIPTGGRARRATSTPARQPIARRTGRHAKAARYQTLAHAVQDQGDRRRALNVRPPPTTTRPRGTDRG